MKTQNALAACIALTFISTAVAFDGRITVTVTRGSETQTLLYTVGTNCLRIERGESDRPRAKDLVARDTGDITLLFPQNRSFVRFKKEIGQSRAGVGREARPTAPESDAFPAPPNIGPTHPPEMPSPPSMPAMPQLAPGGGGIVTMPAMPMISPSMMEKMEFKATGEKTNLLGFVCEKFEIRQRGELMEIWATDKLLPFQPYLQDNRRRFGPRMIDEQWGEMVKAEKLFPLLAVLRFETAPPQDRGAERLRFEVKSVTPGNVDDKEGALFQPPSDYHELKPLPL